MSSRALKKVVKQYVKGAKSTAATSYERLSDREREVLKLLADGLALKEIAVRLVLSVKTVDAHKTNLMRKLGPARSLGTDQVRHPAEADPAAIRENIGCAGGLPQKYEICTVAASLARVEMVGALLACFAAARRV